MNFNNAYYQEQRRKIAARKAEEKEIRRLGNISGIVLIGCFIVALFASVGLAISPIYYDFSNNLSVSSFINMVYSILVVGGSFFVFGKLYKKRNQSNPLSPESQVEKTEEMKTPYTAPKNKLQALLLIIISFGGCMLANYISSFFLAFLSMFGLESTYSSIEDPKNIFDIILMCLSVAVIPPLVEEYSLRGVALSNLKKQGNAFAIIATSIMFGVFHGNATQIPFALICGLFFAYAVVATDSIWTGVIIHALNNILSCIASVMIQISGEDTANTFFNVVSFGGIGLAIICLGIYLRLFKDDGVLKDKGNSPNLTTGQKVFHFLTTPAMIIAILIYGVEALSTLTFSAL